MATDTKMDYVTAWEFLQSEVIGCQDNFDYDKVEEAVALVAEAIFRLKGLED